MSSVRNLMLVGSLVGAIGLSGALLSNQHTAEACIHPPKEFKYPIKAGAQRGLVFFADGREELVIRPSYKVEGEGLKVKNDAVEGFTTVAWLVPVPSLPDSYKEADEKLFTSIADFTKPFEAIGKNGPDQEDGKDSRKKEKHGAEFLEQVKVGDYTIQPVKAHGELGGQELQGWLKSNGFGAVEESVLKHYLENDYYWLAVKLERAEGLPANGEVKPLQIGFKTDKPVYPLKINAGAGEFELEVWVISNKEVDDEKTKAFGLQTVAQGDPMMDQEHHKSTLSDLPEEARKIIDGEDGLKSLRTGDLYITRFFGAGMNTTTDLTKLNDDLHFTFVEPEPRKKD
ncbi:MAG: DUF2330 domain-containing protein [Planctomycetes bacterium]|nr:DUF2330 domain-containing protein [Planctomycetota bacterium]